MLQPDSIWGITILALVGIGTSMLVSITLLLMGISRVLRELLEK